MVELRKEDLLSGPETRNTAYGYPMTFVKVMASNNTAGLRSGDRFSLNGIIYEAKFIEATPTGSGEMLTVTYQ